MPLMTLSIELLPAPFGPIMARISCSSTLNDMFVNAWTPPNLREIESSSRIGAPTAKARCDNCEGAAGLKDWTEAARLNDCKGAVMFRPPSWHAPAERPSRHGFSARLVPRPHHRAHGRPQCRSALRCGLHTWRRPTADSGLQ